MDQNKPEFNAELEDIKEMTATNVNSCQCNKCKGACKVTPCMGTPKDILNLVKAGFSKNLAPTTWLAGVPKGIGPIQMIQPLYDHRKQACTFLEPNGNCALHKLGLKPTEGKLSSCQPPVITGDIKLSLNVGVALTWVDKDNGPVLMEIINELQNLKNPPPQSPSTPQEEN